MPSDAWPTGYRIVPIEVHSDERGALFEMLRFSSQRIPAGGQVYVYTVAPGQRRGDHYHTEKGEWFTCVAGRVQLFLKTKDGEKITLELDNGSPQLIYVGPYTSHAVVNQDADDHAVIVAYSSKEFDPADPDTIMAESD